jgi:hypothetical protein
VGEVALREQGAVVPDDSVFHDFAMTLHVAVAKAADEMPGPVKLRIFQLLQFWSESETDDAAALEFPDLEDDAPVAQLTRRVGEKLVDATRGQGDHD